MYVRLCLTALISSFIFPYFLSHITVPHSIASSIYIYPVTQFDLIGSSYSPTPFPATGTDANSMCLNNQRMVLRSSSAPSASQSQRRESSAGEMISSAVAATMAAASAPASVPMVSTNRPVVLGGNGSGHVTSAGVEVSGPATATSRVSISNEDNVLLDPEVLTDFTTQALVLTVLATMVKFTTDENEARILYEYLAEASVVFPKVFPVIHSLLDGKITNVLAISYDQIILSAVQCIIKNMIACCEDQQQQQLHYYLQSECPVRGGQGIVWIGGVRIISWNTRRFYLNAILP